MLQIIVDSGTLRLFGTSIPLRIYGYGLMLVFGFLLGILLAQWRARRAGENPENLAHCGLLALLGGIIGARIAYIIQHWKVFSRSEDVLGEIFNVTSGGLIYYGGVVLATIIVVLYLLIKRRPIRRYLDIVAVSLMIGLAFGRAGCTLNGCCFGARCSDHWALGMRFPMYSKPLVKFDGRENPYSAGTRDP
ncbi:MAG: prolipoprotein diacylglyceryl transferase, partial [Phycisphaerae bacterium]|nr:prolipoprotein diacylglyceryl transferase [Phycisphaerae bacterium]